MSSGDYLSEKIEELEKETVKYAQMVLDTAKTQWRHTHDV